MTKEQMWKNYVTANPCAHEYDAWSFGGNAPDMPNVLADLVLAGKKTATASAYPCYQAENEPLPPVGGYNIILNTDDEAVCMTKTTKVYTIPFCEVSADHAAKEGEGDRSLQFWRNCHRKLFTEELNAIGKEFTMDMLVVCEEFEVVYPR
ncbi:MAG: ASCH domain-containing protein [Oscillospiraceae bacterium]